MSKNNGVNFLDPFQVGQVVCVTFIAPNAGRININFVGEEDNIVFHTSIRYTGPDFVLNTNTHGVGWGVEERPAGFLFAHGQAIVMRYEATCDGFNVACNGNFITQYEHRMPVTSIKGVHVVWDIDDAETKAKLQSIDIKY